MKKLKILTLSGRFELKKGIYTAATISVLALIFLTIVFINMLDQQRGLLTEIEKRHINSIATLSSQLSKLSSNHVNLVDRLTSAPKNLDVKTVRGVNARYTRDLGRLADDLGNVTDEVSSPKQSAELRQRLIRNVLNYRNSAVAAVSIASLDISSSVKQLGAVNRNYRQVNGDFEALIQQSRDGVHLSIVSALESFDARTYQVGVAVVLIIILLSAIIFIMLRAVSHDVAVITGAMTAVASGQPDVRIPGLERRDKIGEMARATAVFQSNFLQLDELAELEEKGRKLEDEVRALKDTKRAYETKVDILNTSAQSLAEARDAAEAADKAKSELLAVISYEIRTPMNGLMGMAGLILDGDLSNEQREYLADMRESGAALLEVVNNLLDYAKLEAGQLELEVTEFDLIKTIESIPDLVKSDRADVAPDLLFNLARDVPRFLVGDPERYGQTLTNLLTTAIRSSEHGEIEIDISMADGGTDDATIRLEIIDHEAPATTQTARSRINRSWRDQDPQAANSATKGLAMAISERFAELMDGQIGHERADDGNCHYWFTARLGIAANAKTDWPENAKQLSSRRILIVDGSSATREVLGRQLEGWGMMVDRAPDGRAALARMARADSRNQQFDIAIVADTLPDMDGIACIRAMRSASGTGNVKVMLTSAPEKPLAEDQLEQLNIAMSIERPITPLRLFDALTTTLNGRPRARGTRADTDKSKNQGTPIARKLRILLADDNQVNRLLVTKLLKPAGHIVDVVVNGIEAVKAVQTAPYDIVLMDIQMPEMDGVTATREIRCLPGDMANVPIVALTANAMVGDREKYLTAGMDDYIPKPLDKFQLLDAIERLSNNDLYAANNTDESTAGADHGPAMGDQARAPGILTGS